MFTVGENSSDCSNDPRAAIRCHHEDTPLGPYPSDQLAHQGFPGSLGFTVSLDESQVLPFTFLGNPHGGKRGLFVHTLASKFEIGSIKTVKFQTLTIAEVIDLDESQIYFVRAKDFEF